MRYERSAILEAMADGGIDECDVHLFGELGSTNDWSLARIAEDAAQPFVCITEQQTAGRGRRGRTWVSTPDASITFSIAMDVPDGVSDLSLLSLGAGMILADVLRELGVERAMLKWPNDVYVDDRKIAGILIETITRGAHRAVVCGIGINASPVEIGDDGSVPVTDIMSHVPFGQTVDRNQVVGEIAAAVVDLLENYNERMVNMTRRFNDGYDACRGRQVSIKDAQGVEHTGDAMGVSDNGEFKLLCATGEKSFLSGDVSLRLGA